MAAVVTFLVGVTCFALLVAAYAATFSEKYLDVSVRGSEAIVAAFAVGVKQANPELQFSLAGVVRFQGQVRTALGRASTLPAHPWDSCWVCSFECTFGLCFKRCAPISGHLLGLDLLAVPRVQRKLAVARR